jgi:release factor glutamine methyltransferase
VSSAVTGETAVDLLRQGEEVLRAAGLGTARVEAEWLLAAVLGVGRHAAYLEPDRVPGVAETARYRALLARRASREPLQHLLGFEDFHGLRLTVTPATLIPRPETEGLVQWALELIDARGLARVADIGTGSGAIACALASARPALRVVAVDRSASALAVASANAARLGLAGQIECREGDLAGPLVARGERVDLVVANLPYLPGWSIGSLAPEVARHEPRLALDGGHDGMEMIRRLVAHVPDALVSDGALLLEIGPGQARYLCGLLEAAGFEAIEVRRDLCGVERYLGARWPGRSA